MERNTQQRRAILKVLEETQRPLSVQEVLELAQEDSPRLGIATVYRNLKALVAEEKLTAVDMPGNLVLYEMPRKEHHHHFTCTRCQRVFDVDACGFNFRELVPRGFRIQEHEIFLSGFCKSCASAR